MKITFYDRGDPTVGIWPLDLAFDLSEFEFSDQQHREQVREAASALCELVYGERLPGHFEDECPECGRVMEATTEGRVFRAGLYRCTNERCVENFVWED